jgi:hypothetical protein
MTDKAIISAYTHRSLESLRENAQGKPVFVLPDDWSQIFRATTRKTEDRLHVDSLAILAKREDSFREFLDAAKLRKSVIVSKEDAREFVVNGNVENLVKWWKDARRKNVSKIGGDLGAKAKRAAIAERARDMTRGEWTDGSIKNAQLVEKYGASINALKRYASDKGWGHDRQQAIWRAKQRKMRSP